MGSSQGLVGSGGSIGGLAGRSEGGNPEPQQEVLDGGVQLGALEEGRGRKHLAWKGLARGAWLWNHVYGPATLNINNKRLLLPCLSWLP